MPLAFAVPPSLDSSLRSVLAIYARHGRFLPGLLAMVFALLLGRALADLVWALVPTPESARWRPPPAQAAPPRAQATDIDAIANASLFGRAVASTEATDSLLDAPETVLNMTLLGVWADDDEDGQSRALIALQGGEEKSFAIGDDVTRGVTLQAIFPDRVILSRAGRLETLRLERNAPGVPGQAGPPPVAAAEDNSAGAAHQQLAQVRDEVLKDPAKASEYVRIQPANVGGQLKGYRVYPGRDRSAFSSAGLRPGDLVTSVNGVQLDDPAKALQLLGDLGQAGQVNLVVERGGQTQNISINLSQ
ncbi:MAG TPA: type II secretion system protein GspC [Verrucomicrobiae bacterium]|nr:type II secretion system protein GspC [Verrucomicrobiae bacterium]